MSPQTTPPIVRITQEQLEYLIGSLGDDRAARRRLKNSSPSYGAFTATGIGTVPVLNADETRIAIYVGATGGTVSFSTNPNVAIGDSVQVFTTNSIGFVISWQDYGYFIRNQWFANFQAIGHRISWIAINCPGFWDV